MLSADLQRVDDAADEARKLARVVAALE